MARINIKDMYLGRIAQINIDIRASISKKDWKIKAKLEAEKKKIEDFIKKSE
ncbi:hypothetical protein LGL08_20025 [Clostridium estertheticum]|uniref:hypothetical protein n=1 Tax=Clostridium estertheticum TaxID=238834 RepID=UPI001CF55C5C|nr:hypothetical protein [Clostridium estertheticum]MCB2308993.1 hypothetical protein [Clostridium estertheticum]MCB2346873.1 hypothetical protein [Clostridium estertheticum]MCB2351815.1 hypothetical protein [Clostridium estertheticum]WAG48419.1 hypothetical protein LL127_22830 [Clostridium estertheticum]